MPFTHEAIAAWPTPGTGDPDRGLIRAMTTRRFAYCLMADEAAIDFVAKDPVSGVPPAYLLQNSILFAYDETDNTTEGDDITCLVTNDACRYKLDEAFQGSLSFANIAGTVAAAQLPNGNAPGLGTSNTFTDTTDSTTPTTGAQKISGGLGVAKNISTGQKIIANGDVGSFPTIDVGGVGYAIASGATKQLANATSGLLFIQDDGTTGILAIVALVNGAAYVVFQAGSAIVVNTTSPSSSQISVYYDGRYTIKNGFAASRTLYIASIRLRPAN